MTSTRFTLVFTPVIVGAMAFASAPVAADAVKGSVRLAGKHRSLHAPPEGADHYWERRPSYWREWNGFIAAVDPGVDKERELLVVLRGEGPAASDQMTVSLTGGSLSPATLAARPGQKLRLENRDDFAHEVHAEGLTSFAPEATASGRARVVVLGQAAPGSYPVRDRRAPHVRAHLHVMADLIAAVSPNDRGEFSFTNVPAGTYTLEVLHGGVTLHKAEVQVGAGQKLPPIVLTPAKGAGQ